MHIVHIEDDVTLQDIIRTTFQLLLPGIALRQFISADDALPYVEKYGAIVDVFIIDIRLPGALNGLQFAEKLRTLDCPGKLVLTSAFSQPSRDWLMKLNCEYYPKPWHLLELSRKLLQYQLPPKETPAKRPAVDGHAADANAAKSDVSQQ